MKYVEGIFMIAFGWCLIEVSNICYAATWALGAGFLSVLSGCLNLILNDE